MRSASTVICSTQGKQRQFLCFRGNLTRHKPFIANKLGIRTYRLRSLLSCREEENCREPLGLQIILRHNQKIKHLRLWTHIRFSVSRDVSLIHSLRLLPLPWDVRCLIHPSWLWRVNQCFVNVLQACYTSAQGLGNGHTMVHRPDFCFKNKVFMWIHIGFYRRTMTKNSTSRSTSLDSSRTISSKLSPTTIFTSPSFCSHQNQVRCYIWADKTVRKQW